MAGEQKTPIKLIVGIWGSLALVVVLTLLLAKWAQRDHQTMGGVPAFVRSYPVDSGTDPWWLAWEDAPPSHDLDRDSRIRRRESVTALMEHKNVGKLETVLRDTMQREGYRLTVDRQETRIVAEIGIAPEKPGSDVPILHSLKLLDDEYHCMLAFMCCESRLAVPDSAPVEQTDAGALWEFYRQNGLALQRGQENTFYSLITSSADPNRWGQVL